MGALSGYKIIELSGIGPGPLCGMLLSDLGAEVIRIDRTNTAMPQSDPKFDITGRSKKSICLNLKDKDSKDIFFKLIKDADALIEGFRPGVTEKLGIGPDECLKINPKLVYGRITGWGQDGPLSQAAGHDINYIALAGALFSFGLKDSKPSIPINLIGDYAGGTMFLAFGVCAALLSVSKTGKGQVVDAAMIDGVSIMTLGLPTECIQVRVGTHSGTTYLRIDRQGLEPVVTPLPRGREIINAKHSKGRLELRLTE